MLQPRHQQLFDALVAARRAHDEKPCEATFRAKALKLDARAKELTEQLEMHRAAHDQFAVKLVDAAGTLRLDMNGHRVHMNRAQALELMLQIGGLLDTRPHREREDDLIASTERWSHVGGMEDDADGAAKVAAALCSMVNEVRKGE